MNNESVAHNWVYGDKSISSRCSNFSYEYDRLYSYTSLLAKIDREKKIVYIDSKIAGYSHSSRKHTNHLHRAIPGNYSTFEWDFSEDFITCKRNEIFKLIDMESRARKVSYLPQIKRIIDNVNKYIEVHEIKKLSKEVKAHLKDIESIDIDNLIESSAEVIKRDQERLLKIKKLEDKKKQESRQNTLDRFLGQVYNKSNKSTVKYDPNYNSVYLKVDGESIKTTNSIVVPLRESLALYRAYLSGKNIHGLNLGHYSVVKSSKESVTIGCTTISAKELNRVLGNLV